MSRKVHRLQAYSFPGGGWVLRLLSMVLLVGVLVAVGQKPTFRIGFVLSATKAARCILSKVNDTIEDLLY